MFSGVLVYYSTPYVNDFLKTQTPVYSFVESKCETLVEDAIMDKLDKETQKFAQQSDVPRKDQNKIIKSLPIPKELQTQALIITTVTRMQIWRFRPFRNIFPPIWRICF